MRLLNRTLTSFLIYAVAVLLVVTPIFYWVVNEIITEKVDETLLAQKKEIQTRIQKTKSAGDLKLWEDLDGDVVVEPYPRSQINDSIFTRVQFNSFSQEMEPYRVLTTGILIRNIPYRLTARISLVESEDLIEAAAITQLIVLLTLLSGLSIINWWISRRIWRPFYHTLQELKKFEVEKTPSLQLQPSAIKEFEDLNRAITQLTQRDHQVYLNQKEFTENAAHEMQTPLAIFQSKLELLLQTNLSESQAEVMESLLQATSRLTKLNKALLLLSKIDSRQFIETEPVDVVDIISKLISFYEPEAKAKAIRINTNFADNFLVSFNAILIDILFSNLISNAIRHGAPQTEILVSTRGHFLEIQNEGAPMSIPSDKIFERFQKGITNSSSTGLGLAIVKKICDTSALGLNYRFENKRHFFSIRFQESKISTNSLG
jgi:signal transduction histidine kinase